MTIGSFVCTKCSGMLRGLTPPHRVKSISMASFTTEEVELVKSRGNDVCRQTWLALYDQNTNTGLTETKDDQQIKDFMMDKYERKRFYHDKGLRNGTVTSSPSVTVAVVPTVAQQKTLANHVPLPETKPLASLLGTQSSNIQIKSHFTNGTMNGQHTTNGSVDFVADFGSADIFSASSQFNNNSPAATSAQPSFANFDNNVIFNSATYQSSYDLLVSQLTQMPRFVTDRWNVTSSPLTNQQSSTLSNSPMNKVTMPPSEDRYAALKDLDNALKNQQQQQQQQETHSEWNTPSSNGSGYASPSQSGSLYGSPSTAGSLFGSPSQGHFATAFPQHHDMSNNVSNPFSPNNCTRNPWAPNGNGTVVANNYQSFTSANPFRMDNFTNAPVKYNGTTNGYNGNQQSVTVPVSQPQQFHQQQHQQQQQQHQNIFSSSQSFNKPWTSPNPFMMSVTPGAAANSNNPFL
ncbi:drongo [Carabus blaptoides fortunei]